MRIVKRVTLLLALVMCLPHGAQADNIAVGDSVTFAQGIGDTGAPIFVTANGDPTTTFVSFCMQSEVGGPGDFSTTMYVAGISDYATFQPEDQGGDANGRDYLTSQTAWLYTGFRDGTLTGFDGSRIAATALQWAIWQLQGEKTVPEGEDWSALATSFIDLSNQAVTNGFTGTGNVGVLNLVYANGTDAQDQLTLLPEPSSLELLGLGAVALFFSRRRLFAARAQAA